MTQQLWIPGNPYPERRKLHSIVGRGKTARVHLRPHPKTEAYRKKVVEPAIAAAKLVRIPKPAGVEIVAVFYLPRPKSHMGTGKNAGTVKGSSPAFPIGSDTGDFENLVKVVCDALTGILWDDDSQVIRGRIDKVYADDGQATGVSFHARALPGTMAEVREMASAAA